MNWLSSIGIIFLTGILGLVVTGAICTACVSWYNISGFEGKSGYFVVFTAILGGFAGGVIGLIAGRIVAAGADPGFLKGLGYACGSVLAIAAVATMICRFLADIPPKIDGAELFLEVEFRMPATSTPAPPTSSGEWKFWFGSLSGHVQREAHKGDLKNDAARLEDGKWIVPGRAFIFTRRGKRLIRLEQDEKSIAGYLVPLPARPGKKFLEWSAWLPKQLGRNQPWPADKPMYRFRVVKEVPLPPPPDPAVVEAAEFAALKPEAPLEEWLKYLEYDSPEERVQAIMAVVEPRSAELIPMILSTNMESRELALTAVPKLAQITPEMSQALLTEAERIAEGIARFNEMSAEDPKFYDIQIEWRHRFNRWKQPWWTTFHRLNLDGRPPVQKIHELALIRSKGTSMDEIVINATAILNALPAPATSQP